MDIASSPDGDHTTGRDTRSAECGRMYSYTTPLVPLKYIEYGAHGDLIIMRMVSSIFYLLEGGYILSLHLPHGNPI